MATIKWGAIGVDVRGSIGGTIFSRNANASYAKNFTRPTNPDTAAQQQVRGIFSAVQTAWRSLTEEQRQSWIDAAPNFPYTNKVGDTSYYTGSQLFSKINTQLRQLNPTANLLTEAPDKATLADIYSVEIVDFTVNSGALTASIDILTSLGTALLPAGQQVLVSATAGLSQGVYRPKRFKQVGVYTSAGTSIDISADYVAKLGLPGVGTKVFIKVETVEVALGQKIPGAMAFVTVAS